MDATNAVVNIGYLFLLEAEYTDQIIMRGGSKFVMFLAFSRRVSG